MRIVRVLLVPTVLLSLATLAFSDLSDASSSGPCYPGETADPADVEELRRLELRGARSNVEGWTLEEAKAFFAPKWVSVGPDGKVEDVNSVFSSFVDGRAKPWAARFELLELEIRVYGGAAVVIGLAEAEGIGAPAGTRPTRFRYLNVWRKVDGRWLYSEQQFTRF